MPLQIILLIFGSYLLSKIWKSFGPLFYFVAFFGVMVHEFWHIIGCLLTGAKIQRIKISTREGFVRHKKSKIPILGAFIISTIPFPGAILTIYILSVLLGISPTSIAVDSFDFTLFTNYQFLIFLYLSIGIIICMIPSKKDFKNAMWGTALLFLFIILFHLFDIGLNFPGSLLNIVSFSFSVSVLTLLVSSPFYLLKRIIFN